MLSRQAIMKSIMLQPFKQYVRRYSLSEAKSCNLQSVFISNAHLNKRTDKSQDRFFQQKQQNDNRKLKICQNRQCNIQIIPKKKDIKNLQIITIKTPGSEKSSEKSFFVFQNSLVDVKDMFDNQSKQSELYKTKKKLQTTKNADLNDTGKMTNFDTIVQQNQRQTSLRKSSDVSEFTFHDKSSNQSSGVQTESYQIEKTDKKARFNAKTSKINQTVKPVKRIHQLKNSKMEMSVKNYLQNNNILTRSTKKRLLKSFLQEYKQKCRSPSRNKNKIPKNIERGLFYN